MKNVVFFLFCLVSLYSLAQVVAEGDTILCDGQQGEFGVTLTATSFAVDLTDANIYTDDIFGSVIDMGFNFDFYGNTYNQVVLSSNNYLSFNTANAGGFSGWAINEAVPNNFDAPLNAILCPWQDIYPGVDGNGTIQYATTGEAPNRVFIASFCGIPMFSCTDICYSSQIKLYESTNVIETHIAQKVLCTTWNGGVAIHALHNADGTIAHVVTGLDGVERNYPNQWTCENDGWRFTPNGANDYIVENIEFAPAVAGTDIIWQDQFGNQIGTGGEIVVFPDGTTTYTAGASLCGDAGDWCGFEGGIEGDEVLVVFESVEIESVEIVNTPCDDPNGGSAIVFIEGSGGPYNYSWENSFGDTISNSAASIGGLSSDTYQFTISTISGCEDTIEIFIDTDGTQVTDAITGEDIEVCETETILTANAPLDGEIGYWTLVSGQGSIINPANSETTVTNLGFGENVFAWTLENECGSIDDQLIVYLINGTPTVEELGTYSCLEQIALSATVENGEGQWSVTPTSGVSIDDVTSLNTFATIENYGTYTFTFEGCNGQDSDIVYMTSSSPILDGPEFIYCLEAFQLNAVISGDYGYWDYIGPGNVGFSNPDNVTTTVSVDDYGLYEFIYYGCGTSSSIFVDVLDPNPTIEDPGIIYCNLETEVIANSLFSGTWSLTDPNSQITIVPNENSCLMTVPDYGDYNIVFTSCGISDTLTITFATVDPYINISDNNNCIFTIDLNVITPDPNGGPWQCLLAPPPFNPMDVTILDSYTNSTQALVPAYGIYAFSFTSCNVTDTIEIGVSCPITVPNSFSPNGDGVNDFFEITDIDLNVHTQSVFYVFNRWGGVVYIDSNYGLNGEWWDGRMMFHNRQLSNFVFQKDWDNNQDYVSDGVYFYTLEVYNSIFKQKEFYSGEISIFTQTK